jgi:PAS domain S-box-containing protein
MSINGGSSTSVGGQRAWWIRYGVAALAVLDAFAIFIMFPGVVQAPGTPQILLSLSVLIAAWYGGLGPGLFAGLIIVLCMLCTGDLRTPNAMQVLIFGAQCLLCSALMESLHRSRKTALSEAATRRASESALRRSDGLQSAVLTSAFDCIITLDARGRIVEFNPAAEQTFGLARADAIGRELREFIDFPNEAEQLENHSPSASTAAQVVKARDRTELSARRQDGTPFPIELSIAPFGVDGDRFFAAYLREITARKRLEDELRRQAEALRQASQTKDEFLAMLAHELRNPLAALSGAAAISARSTDPEDLEWSRNTIQRNIKQLARLIDDLLDVSRVTQGKIDLRKEHLEASPVIDQAVDSIHYLLAPKGHQIAVSLDRGSLWVDADPARLQQIVANLLANAIQYSEEGSYIRLRAQRLDGEILISVRDRGQGIRPELLPHVFELFKQGDRSLARTEGGLGIGLTMVRALAELHGGIVTAWSDGPGKGSEFVVRLPAGSRKDQPASIQPVKPPPSRRSGNRVLVVDDNVDLSRALTTLLSRFGYEAQAVNDGHAAIEAARALRPEVVLLDLGLPGIDGFEVARRLRYEEGFHDTIIIAITGYGQEDGSRYSREEGFNHHLIKPVQIEALVALLESVG